MKMTLDMLSALEAWQTMADESMGTLLHHSTETTRRVDETAARIANLEVHPTPPPLPPLPPPPPCWQTTRDM